LRRERRRSGACGLTRVFRCARGARFRKREPRQSVTTSAIFDPEKGSIPSDEKGASGSARPFRVGSRSRKKRIPDESTS
jgi:hypothetical protein